MTSQKNLHLLSVSLQPQTTPCFVQKTLNEKEKLPKAVRSILSNDQIQFPIDFSHSFDYFSQRLFTLHSFIHLLLHIPPNRTEQRMICLAGPAPREGARTELPTLLHDFFFRRRLRSLLLAQHTQQRGQSLHNLRAALL